MAAQHRETQHLGAQERSQAPKEVLEAIVPETEATATDPAAMKDFLRKMSEATSDQRRNWGHTARDRQEDHCAPGLQASVPLNH